VELAEQRGVSGVHLHPVEVGVDRELGGPDEPVDDGGDVLGFHRRRHLAADDVGHP
jgi:hypothetical protein